MKTLVGLSFAIMLAISSCTVTPVLAQSKIVKQTHDCAFFSRGAGGFLFSYGIDGQAAKFAVKFPRARTEVHEHWWPFTNYAGCKNPLFVGHSMGARKAIEQGNSQKKGRVVSIDPPAWMGKIYSSRPTVSFYQAHGLGANRWVYGPSVKQFDLTKEGRGHVGLGASPTITKEILR